MNGIQGSLGENQFSINIEHEKFSLATGDVSRFDFECVICWYI